MFQHCENYINTAKEVRHLKVLQLQVSKLKDLYRSIGLKRVAAQSRIIVIDTCMAATVHTNTNTIRTQIQPNQIRNGL